MNRDRQIEEIDEIQTVIYEANHKKSVLDYRWLATELYNKGYRKASEVAKELITEIEQNFEIGYGGVFEFKKFLAELKKKYESEGEKCDIT